MNPLNKESFWILATLLSSLLSAGPIANAGKVPIKIQFGKGSYTSTEKLQSKGWIVQSDKVNIPKVKRGSSFLRLGGESAETPRIEYPFDKPMPRGTLTFNGGTAASYVDAYIRLMKDDKTLAYIHIPSPTKLNMGVSPKKNWNDESNSGFSMNIGGGYATDKNAKNELQISLSWDATGTGNGKITYRLHQPLKENGNAFDTGEIQAKFMGSGVPNRLVIETLKHDHHARIILIKNLQISK